MLYYLFDYLESAFHFPGAGLFQYISFRAAAAVITSLIITMLFGKRLINFLHKKQVGESIRDLGLEGQMEKQGTPTMGGLIILGGILIPTLLFAKLDNIYIQLILFSTVWLGMIGFVDDYIKVFKKDKQGLSGKFKVLGQIILGIVVGLTMYFADDVVMREKIEFVQGTEIDANQDENCVKESNDYFKKDEIKSTKTTIPFVKNNEFDYAVLLKWIGPNYKKYAYLIFIPLVILIIVAVSNGANMTDGLDGLATSTSAIIAATLGIFAWVSGNFIFADYLNIMYLPNTSELAIYISAFVGACIGFLWYNSYPAQIFMGDTGSLSIGGIIAVFAIIIRKELLIPILCGIFLIENLSVVMQVSYFKYTKKRSGEGKRIFRMAPLHHHYQKKGYHEAKIVQRFFIIGIMLAVFTILTLKIR
ncbi:MAG: phospho-N-acetylmuramoyl-pentapeptide-transferase [Saprospiraceae bacterium]|nr:phospho-N-acetylmuramoyl-pentapeptide-transferase [Saprospiraceae bacterium]